MLLKFDIHEKNNIPAELITSLFLGSRLITLYITFPGTSMSRKRGGHNPSAAPQHREPLAARGGQAEEQTARADTVRLQYRQHM